MSATAAVAQSSNCGSRAARCDRSCASIRASRSSPSASAHLGSTMRPPPSPTAAGPASKATSTRSPATVAGTHVRAARRKRRDERTTHATPSSAATTPAADSGRSKARHRSASGSAASRAVARARSAANARPFDDGDVAAAASLDRTAVETEEARGASRAAAGASSVARIAHTQTTRAGRRASRSACSRHTAAVANTPPSARR